jgi:hypothetical protein
MACYTGKDGALSLGGTNIAQLSSWTVTSTVDTIECTHMGQSWKTYKTGIAEWEGSFEAIYDGDKQGLAAEMAVGTQYEMFAYPESTDTDHSLSGSVILTSLEWTAELDDVIRLSATFTGTGEFTKATVDLGN